jgi:serine protease AprX
MVPAAHRWERSPAKKQLIGPYNHGERLPMLVAVKRLRLLPLVLTTLGIASGFGATPPAQAHRVSVIVTAESGRTDLAAGAVARVRGKVTRRLNLVGGVAATVDQRDLGALRGAPGVRSVTPNDVMTPLAAAWDPNTDIGGSKNVSEVLGSSAYWNAGFTGRGVDVALIDSGVRISEALPANRVLFGPDLSFESQNPATRNVDTYGHGTHMAGLIAGKASAASVANPASGFIGIAPDARVVSVKVADAMGSTDVSQVIAAIDWVVANRNKNGLNIRVMNLSYGTDSTQDVRVDPLSFAVDQAWRQGIVVVAASGNAGFADKTGSMTNPARTNTIIAVGALGQSSSRNNRADDEIADFSSNGSKERRPDFVVPGKSIVSLRAPGSTIDTKFGSTGSVNDQLFRGSGTSQAAAITSGAAALIIQQNPGITADSVKRVMTDSTVKLKKVKPEMQGKGALDLRLAFASKRIWTADGPPKAELSGGGSLDASRGSGRLIHNGVPLTGERDIFGAAFNSVRQAQAELTGSTWSGGTWSGSTWSGSTWSGSTWSGATWSGSTWSGSTWSGATWSGATWSNANWSGNVWSDAFWG